MTRRERCPFTLPPEQAARLTRAADPHNIATPMLFIALLGKVEDQIVDSFRNGGGVPYSAFSEFRRLMAENSAQVHDNRLIDGILPEVPAIVERLNAGIDAADVGCGQGHAINLMARAFPKSRFTGYDFSEAGIAAGRSEAQAWGLTYTTFVLQDAAKLDIENTYVAILVFDAIHDQAQPRVVLANIARALKPNSTFLMVDIKAASDVADNVGHPFGPFLYSVSAMHCMTVSLSLGGEGLGAVWGEATARALLQEAGLTIQDIKQIEGDPFNSYYIATKA